MWTVIMHALVLVVKRRFRHFCFGVQTELAKADKSVCLPKRPLQCDVQEEVRGRHRPVSGRAEPAVAARRHDTDH